MPTLYVHVYAYTPTRNTLPVLLAVLVLGSTAGTNLFQRINIDWSYLVIGLLLLLEYNGYSCQRRSSNSIKKTAADDDIFNEQYCCRIPKARWGSY